MQFPRSRRHSDEDERILPLTNVIFLLLIFFMLVGRLSSPDAFAIQPPHSSSEALPDSGGLLVQVSANGELAIEGDPIRPAALKPAVQAYLEAHPQGEGIRLKADGLVDSTRVVAVMNVMRDAGVERLQLLTITTEN